ncbi:hypothetical protein BD310DRAFT_401624 [Dichomitus squalens]|uniref:Uncharacterized protein n=1 Tax=Dichomitus squalens TaxID=114155 RepID=A0A4Q9QB79_9APHY|nr:hypothetical protein BD310DRAFT_401624 [Dichomitus squalens]
MSETGERANIDLEWMIGLEGTLRESQSLLGDPSLLGELSSRIGSQIDRRCCPGPIADAVVPVVPALAPPPGLPPGCTPWPPSDSRPIADELLSASASGHTTRPRSSPTPDQRAYILSPSLHRAQPFPRPSLIRCATRNMHSAISSMASEILPTSSSRDKAA